MDAQSFDLSAASFSVSTTTALLALAGFKLKSYSAYQYTQDGGVHLDGALNIINGPRGTNIEAPVLEAYARESRELTDTRDSLEEKTNSCVGSIVHWNEARDFHKDARVLLQKATSASNRANINKTLEEIEKRKQQEQREAWERYGPDFQVQALALAQDPSRQNISTDMPFNPPSEYQSSNSARC